MLGGDLWRVMYNSLSIRSQTQGCKRLLPPWFILWFINCDAIDTLSGKIKINAVFDLNKHNYRETNVKCTTKDKIAVS